MCQVDEVRKCLKPKELQKALKSLPRTLDDTYARILCNIDEQHSADVFKILQWLVYSTRPMAIEEIAEVVAIDTEGDCRLDLENRLREPHDILAICSSLVTTTTSTVTEGHERSREIEELKLAHFSVKEYLISDRMRNTKASRYSLTDYPAHDYIARTCLVYLLHFDEPTSLTLDNIHEFPLVEYAARYWTQHVKEVEKETHEYKAQELCMKLLSLQDTAHFIWLRLLYSSKPWEKYCTIAVPESVLSPLYFSSLNGLIVSTKILLEAGADVNTQAGEYDNALQADINVQDEAYGNALQAASSRGYETVVRLLLDAGANVNAQGGLYGDALQAASNREHETVIRLLLDAGANVNAQGGLYGNALQAASAEGHETVIRLLLDAGANVNAQDENHGNALQEASAEGHETVVRLLLEKGAKVNAQGGLYGNALQAASNRGHETVVRLLLDAGANVNAQGGLYGNALQAASNRGHETAIRLLLDAGANVNAQRGKYGNALQAASAEGHEAVIQLLLEKGANVNAQGGKYGNALQAASAKGHEAAIRLLLDAGANVNAQGGKCGTALQAAIIGQGEMVSHEKYEAAIQLLLKAGAKVNAEDEEQENRTFNRLSLEA